MSGITTALLVVVIVALSRTNDGVAALSPAAQIYIANSFSGANISCDTVLNQTNCSLTLGCVWNATNTSATPNGTCLRQASLVVVNGTGQDSIQNSWCFEYFPEWFISILYFLCCAATGFSIAGMWYNYQYYDVYVTMLDGERMYNRFYFKTSPINAYLAVLVITSVMLFGSAMAYFNDPYSCSYIAFSFVFLVVCLGVPLIAGVAYAVWLLLEYLNRREMHVNLDEYIRPTTQEAMPKYNNQVRCF